MDSSVSTLDRKIRYVPALLIGGALATLMATAAAGLAPAIRTRLGWTAAERPAYSVGDVIDIPRGLHDRADRTLVVFASGTCGACLRSAVALRAIAADVRRSQGHLVVITPKEQWAAQQELADRYALEASQVIAMDLGGLRLKYVPTVAVVDRAGRVRYVHEGVVDEEGRAAIERAFGLGQF